MAARRRRETHYWIRARAGSLCAWGSHRLIGGAFVRIRVGDPFRRMCCEHCLAPKGITRPGAQQFDFDVRMARANDDSLDDDA
jgi:hypothetical protein